MDLKAREEQLKAAHKALSKQIEALLDQRIKIAGALEENLYMQKGLEKKPPEHKEKK